MPKILIHSDFSPRNVVFKGDEIEGIFDLEHMRKEVRLYDLNPLLKMGAERGRFDSETASKIISAYNNSNPLTPEEIVALPEVFRNKLLERACRIVNPHRHFDARFLFCRQRR